MAKQLRYLEIARVLKNRIIDGALQNGTLLPSQKELSVSFKTSVMTIRQALSVLEEEGLISVVHGTGTFVSAQRMHSENISLQGFQNEMDSKSMKISTEIIQKDYGIKNSKVKRIFKDNVEKFSVLTRLRKIGEKPVILQRSYIPDEYKEIIETYSRESSLYQIMSEKAGLMLTKGREIVIPAVIAEPESGLLEVNSGEPVFLSQRISLSLDGRVVIFDEAFLPGQSVFIASARYGRNNKFKYIIRRKDESNETDRFSDAGLWEDLE